MSQPATEKHWADVVPDRNLEVDGDTTALADAIRQAREDEGGYVTIPLRGSVGSGSANPIIDYWPVRKLARVNVLVSLEEARRYPVSIVRSGSANPIVDGTIGLPPAALDL